MFTVSILKMLGLDPAVAMHCLAIEAERCPMKKALRCMHPDLSAKVEVKVDKLVKVGFIREVKNPIWLANLVLL